MHVILFITCYRNRHQNTRFHWCKQANAGGRQAAGKTAAVFSTDMIKVERKLQQNHKEHLRPCLDFNQSFLCVQVTSGSVELNKGNTKRGDKGTTTLHEGERTTCLFFCKNPALEAMSMKEARLSLDIRRSTITRSRALSASCDTCSGTVPRLCSRKAH